MKLLYGTSNPSKLQHMREMLYGLGIEITGLDDIKLNIEVDESGNNPLENARIKAMAYYRASGISTFSCDSGLYIEGFSDEEQPGVHVRRVGDKYLNDEEFIEYYSKLVSDLGREPRAKFTNAICLVIDENKIFEHDGDDIADHILMTSNIHPARKAGFPMDSISLDIETGQYLIETGRRSRNEQEITEGFRRFFKQVLSALGE